MKCEALNEVLLKNFPDAIFKSAINSARELYLDIAPAKVREVCIFLNKELSYPLTTMFANDERAVADKYVIYYTFADRDNGLLVTIKTAIDPKAQAFHSISDQIHAAALYEREIKDLFGLLPLGHPDPKRLVFHGNWPEGEFPLRKDYDPSYKPAFIKKEMPFTKIEGEGVFEIPVGPVHAGIIEPGHFRFSVAGEPIINLEAQLYFVHKGIEKLAEGKSIEKCFYISERISGDETFANSLAYCQAIESIAKVTVPSRAQYSRVIFAELERLTSHLGDLAGICLDTAYGFAAFQFRLLRMWAYILADELCGARFLRSVNKLGGIRRDFIAGKEKRSIEQLERTKQELEETIEIIRAKSMFVDRVENTGVLQHDIAVDLNAVGPGGRAAGVHYDTREAFPYEAYGELEFNVSRHNIGDVNCRMNVKLEECLEAINLIIQAIEAMPQGKIHEPVEEVEPYRFAFGMTEAPRGENVHWVMTGENNSIYRYKVRTPSFCNWPALCHAVKGNIVPDFPLINKSFNLSYAGNDL